MEITKEISYGYCQCGCGELTTISPYSCASRNRVKGEPMKFIQGHHARIDHPMKGVHRFGIDNPTWKGGRYILKRPNTSYVMVMAKGHQRASKDGYVLEHILVVEKALGFSIGKKAVIHHIDKNGLNNNLCNLMVFKNNADHTNFHKLLNAN